MFIGLNNAITGLTQDQLSKTINSLFSKNEQGAWFDPSDFSTMFQDAAGTTPVTGMEQPVGLILDKSKGAIRNNGAAAYNFLFYTEEITNAYWVPTAVSKSATTAPDETNTAVKVAAAAVNTQHHVLPIPEPIIPAGNPVLKYSFYAKAEGYRYLGIWGFNALSYFDLIDGVVVSKSVDHISATITKLSGGWNYIDIRFVRVNINSYRIYTIETPGVHIFLGDGVSGCSIWRPDLRLESNADAQPVYQPIGSGTWLSQIPGNHATQTTTTSRPVLSARVNLLTKTEQFDDVYWRLFGVASTTSSITEDTLNSVHEILSPDSLIVTGQVTTISIEAKAGTATHIQLTFTGGANPFANFDLVNGVVSLSGNSPISTTIVNAGNGYFRCTLTSSGSGSSGGGAVSICLIDNNPTATRRPLYAGTGKSAFIRKVDLRVANVGTNLPAYQRVNTATDYDTAGFPHYLLFDGVDDYLVTNSINFTATDKMTVVAGVRKLSDVAAGVIAEINDGSVGENKVVVLRSSSQSALAGASSPFSNYEVMVHGSLAQNVSDYSSYLTTNAFTAPTTSVLSLSVDIALKSIASASLRANALVPARQSGIFTGASMSGNLPNAPLYIGRRGGITLPFNGQLYGLVIRGALSSTGEIQGSESYMNLHTGAY